MSYIAEFFKFRKTGKNAGKYLFYRRMSVDQVSDLRVGEFFNIKTKSGKLHRYFVDRKEHIFYDVEGEYFDQFFIREIEVV